MTGETRAMAAMKDLAADEPSRWRLIRRVVIFQVKLLADAVRDLAMSPLSIAVAGIGIVTGGRHPHGMFDRLMHVGRVTDDWIDLFDHHARTGDRPSLEKMIDEVEKALRDDHANGGVTAEAERRLRAVAEELRRRASRKRQGL